MRVGQSLAEGAAALCHDLAPAQQVTQFRGPFGGVEVAGEGDHAAGHIAEQDGVQGVQQGGGGQVGRFDRGKRRAESGLGEAGHRRFGQDEQRRGTAHFITDQKSRVARSDPRTEPDTFEVPPARGR